MSGEDESLDSESTGGGSFVDRFAKKAPSAKSAGNFQDKLSGSRGDLVYLVRGKDRGRDAWHYVLVNKPLLPIFLEKTNGGSIDVAEYGEVLYSGWGKDPSQDIVDKIEKEYG